MAQSVHPTISFFVRENSIQNKIRKNVFYNFFNGGSLGRAGAGRERNLQTHYGLHGENGNYFLMHGNLSKIQVSSFARYKTYPSPSVEYKQVSHYPSESCLCLQRSTHRPRPALLGPDPDAGTQKGLGGRSAPGERQWPVPRRIYFLRHATRSLTSARAPRTRFLQTCPGPRGEGRASEPKLQIRPGSSRGRLQDRQPSVP